MAVLKVKDAAGNWLDIAGTGTQGRDGGPVPVGGEPGEVIVKTGAADMEVGWAQHPRIVINNQYTSVTTSATVNTMTELINVSGLFYADRTYQIHASHRCIQDLGVGGNAQMRVSVGTVNLQGYDVVSCTDPNSLWGAWSQTWLHLGSLIGGTAAGVDLAVRVAWQCSIASRIIYTPRLHVIEF
jgi:hypothetical protein